jgi:ElaB/YqjD/DUF883 family membrane-anchored ribosome-binding protein
MKEELPMPQQYRRLRQYSLAEVQRFLSATEGLLKTVQDDGMDSTSILRERVAAGIEALQEQVDDAMELADEAAESGVRVVRDNPRIAVLLCALAAMAVGWAVSSRGRIAFR